MYWRGILLLEMLARVIKQMIQAKLRDMSRSLKQPGDEPYKQVVINELNLVFGKRMQSSVHWRNKLKEEVIKKFAPKALSLKERDIDYNLKVC
jgi:hypothetical protein